MRKFLTASTAAVSLVLGGCVTNETFSNQNVGTVAGAGVGILAGSMFGRGNGQLIAMAVGGALGAWAGNSIGAKLDENSRAKRQAAAEAALNAPVDAAPVVWSSPDAEAPAPVQTARTSNSTSAASGSPTARRRDVSGSVRTVSERTDTGKVCRVIEEEVEIAGEKEKVRSTFCKERDVWVAQSG